MIIDHEITSDMLWGEILNCVETLRLLAGIRPMDTERFFRKPNDTYAKYFMIELKPNLHLIPKDFYEIKSVMENKLDENIAQLGNKFLLNEPLSADTWYGYHTTKLRPMRIKATKFRSKK